MSRVSKIEEAARLRSSGLTYEKVGERMGVGAAQVHRWLNPERHAVAQRRRRERVSAVLCEAKDVPCVDCGGRFPPICMDFDHKDSEKTVKLTDWARRIGVSEVAIKRLREEIARCDVVCANCHRIRHQPVRPAGNPSDRQD